MSVRPRSGAPNPGRGGDGRRLRWSESPIPRPGVRRARAAGVTAPPVYAAYSATTSAGASASSITIGLGAGDADDDLAVVTIVACGYSAISPPSGWTTLANNSMTNMTYCVAWTTVTTGTSYAFGLSGAGNNVASRSYLFRDSAGLLTPALNGTVTEDASNTVENLPPVASGAILPYQVMGFAVASPPTNFTPVTHTATIGDYGASYNVSWGGVIYTMPLNAGFSWTGPLPTSDTVTSSVAGEWFSVGIGLTL